MGGFEGMRISPQFWVLMSFQICLCWFSNINPHRHRRLWGLGSKCTTLSSHTSPDVALQLREDRLREDAYGKDHRGEAWEGRVPVCETGVTLGGLSQLKNPECVCCFTKRCPIMSIWVNWLHLLLLMKPPERGPVSAQFWFSALWIYNILQLPGWKGPSKQLRVFRWKATEGRSKTRHERITKSIVSISIELELSQPFQLHKTSRYYVSHTSFGGKHLPCLSFGLWPHWGTLTKCVLVFRPYLGQTCQRYFCQPEWQNVNDVKTIECSRESWFLEEH